MTDHPPTGTDREDDLREEAARVLMAYHGAPDDDQDAYDAACRDWDILTDAGLIHLATTHPPTDTGLRERLLDALFYEHNGRHRDRADDGNQR